MMPLSRLLAATTPHYAQPIDTPAAAATLFDTPLMILLMIHYATLSPLSGDITYAIIDGADAFRFSARLRRRTPCHAAILLPRCYAGCRQIR